MLGVGLKNVNPQPERPACLLDLFRLRVGRSVFGVQEHRNACCRGNELVQQPRSLALHLCSQVAVA